MADITYGYTPTAAAVVSPTGIGQNLYDPDAPATSLAEMNGLVAQANLDPAYKIRSGLIRDRSMGDGKMVGSTMTADYMASLNTIDSTDTGSYSPIPGACCTYFLPKVPACLWATWQIVVASDAGSTAGTNTHMVLKVDGTTFLNAKRYSPIATFSVGGDRILQRDRVYSGSIILTAAGLTAVGWHTASILYWGGVYSLDSVNRLNQSGMNRFRVRNMKVFWLM